LQALKPTSSKKAKKKQNEKEKRFRLKGFCDLIFIYVKRPLAIFCAWKIFGLQHDFP